MIDVIVIFQICFRELQSLLQEGTVFLKYLIVMKLLTRATTKGLNDVDDRLAYLAWYVRRD